MSINIHNVICIEPIINIFAHKGSTIAHCQNSFPIVVLCIIGTTIGLSFHCSQGVAHIGAILNNCAYSNKLAIVRKHNPTLMLFLNFVIGSKSGCIIKSRITLLS